MEKRYVAGQPLDREALLEVLKKYEVDELWVDFDNPFNYVRNGHRLDDIYIIWDSQDKADKYWNKSSNAVIRVFDPDLDSDEDEIVAAVELMSFYFIDHEEMFKFAESVNTHITKIYDREVGFIG